MSEMFTPAEQGVRSPDEAIADAAAILRAAIEEMQPDCIVSMVSGGQDSAASDAVTREIGIKVDLVIHGNTRTGIPEVSQFVERHYSELGSDYAVADAGTAYEDYVLRKGFFGVGRGAHNFAYRVLKATPFRKVISAKVRQRKRGVKVLLINGARRDESENRAANLKVMRSDPAAPGNIWLSPLLNWTQADRDSFTLSRGVEISPVAIQLCKSGECFCGTMQTPQERAEASALYPTWGARLDALEREARALHGFGWGESFPSQPDLFEPMCVGCSRRAA